MDHCVGVSENGQTVRLTVKLNILLKMLYLKNIYQVRVHVLEVKDNEKLTRVHYQQDFVADIYTHFWKYNVKNNSSYAFSLP